MEQVSVRYIVHDVDAAMRFYVRRLGFTEVMHPAPGFAMLTRGALRLLLSAPGSLDARGIPGGGGRAMADGSLPAPGGWNRISLQMPELDATVSLLRAAGISFRSDIMEGIGVRQVLVEDPSGNLVELFEPLLPEAVHKSF